jgi:Predicted nucleotide-binding protein containing TIR-like domain
VASIENELIMARKKMFIGSSGESKNLAEAVKAHLRDLVDATIWNQNFFELGKGTLDTLVGAAGRFDFAAFILASDDDIQYRGKAGTTPRANVVFELGLFMGALGSDRVFAVFGDQMSLFIPSDFAGVTVAKYESANLDLADYPSCEKAAKSACDEIRLAILRYKPIPPAPRSAILTDRTVRSIASYLSFKQEEVNIAVDADDGKAVRQFDSDCHAVVSGSHIYKAIKDALGTPFGFYVQAVGAVGEEAADRRYLNCCIRPGGKLGDLTYLDALLRKNKGAQPKTKFIEDDIAKVISLKSFGHWLLSRTLDPVPLALVIDCSRKSRWDAQILLSHETPLVFTIDASATSDDFDPALEKFKDVTLAELDDRFKSLKAMLSDHKEDYMGRIIKSVLFIPIHGWPGITLQLLTRERLMIDTQTPQIPLPPVEAGDPPVRLTVDELMSIRLCGERLQGLLAHKVQPMPHNTGQP